MIKMTPSEKLQRRIAELQEEKSFQEDLLRASFKEIAYDLNLSTIAKNGLQNLVVNREVQNAATGTALKVGTRFLAFKVLGRFGGPIGAVAAAIAGSLSDRYLDQTTPKMLKAAGKIFKRKKRKATAENKKEADQKE